MSKRGPRFTQQEKLAILKEGEKTGVKAVCGKYGVSQGAYRFWKYKARGIEPRRRFSEEEKLAILREGEKNCAKAVCAEWIDTVGGG
jgi:transposase-like protein